MPQSESDGRCRRVNMRARGADGALFGTLSGSASDGAPTSPPSKGELKEGCTTPVPTEVATRGDMGQRVLTMVEAGAAIGTGAAGTGALADNAGAPVGGLAQR